MRLKSWNKTRTQDVLSLRSVAFCLGVFVCLLFGRPLYAQPTIPPDTPVGSVTGRVTNGTAASSVPSDLQVTLLVSEQGATVHSANTIVASEGSFVFDNVPIIADADYIAAVIHRDHIFSSPFVKGSAAPIDLPITIYEPTQDPSVLSIIGTVIQVNPGAADTLEFRQVVRFRNSSDRIYTTQQDVGGGHFASVVITLPPGAQVVSFDDPNRYIVAEEDFTVVDTVPIFPGDDNLSIVVYILPYDGKAAVIEQPFNYPFQGQGRLLISNQALAVKSDQLPELDKETLGETEYQAYGALLDLTPGGFIRYELSGGGASAASSTSAASGDSVTMVLAVITALAIAIIGGLLFMRTRRPAAPSTDQIIDGLIRQIEMLDRNHADGELNHDVWQRQRGALKARLDTLLGEGEGG